MKTGRPLKNNADYFTHDFDASEDPKIMYIESKFGFKGYAFYFKMLEILTRSDYFQIELNEINKAIICKKIGITICDFDDMLSECIREEVRAFVIQDNCLTSPGLTKRLGMLVEKRNYDRSRKDFQTEKSDKSQVDGVFHSEKSVFHTEKSTFPSGKETVKESKVKESKVKESKVKESKEENIIINGDGDDENFTPPDFDNFYDKKICRLYLTFFGKSPPPMDMGTLRSFWAMIGTNGDFQIIVDAFKKAREVKGDKMNLAYIRAIINNSLNKDSKNENGWDEIEKQYS